MGVVCVSLLRHTRGTRGVPDIPRVWDRNVEWGLSEPQTQTCCLGEVELVSTTLFKANGHLSVDAKD
jgi:hypothetical protein